MEQLTCQYCLSENVEFKEKGPHLGAYCKDCGGFIKWVKKERNDAKTVPLPFVENSNNSHCVSQYDDLPWYQNDVNISVIHEQIKREDSYSSVAIKITKYQGLTDLLITKCLDFAHINNLESEMAKLIADTLNEIGFEYEVKE
jgi:hypothetical protein